MYIAIYVDSFFIFQFVMNLFVLGLVNGTMKQKIGKKKRAAGASVGAILSIIPLLLPVNMYVRIGSAFALSLCCMFFLVFRIYNADSLYRTMEKVVVCTLMLGGLMLVILRLISVTGMGKGGLLSVLMSGLISYVVLRKIMSRHSNVENLCKVTLFGEETLEVRALIDTGNSLTEPISGKPVSVLDRSAFDRLFHHKPEVYRAIPYHSVGRKCGILQGFLVKRMIVETKEGRKEYKEVYVGISEELTAKADTYKMILNPRIME